MFSPNVYQGASSVIAYFPKAVWYDFWTYTPQFNVGQWLTLPAALDEIPIHILGGSVIPRQTPAMTSEQTKRNPFEIVFALDMDSQAQGELFLDDGEDLVVGQNATLIRFSALSRRVCSEIVQDDWIGSSNLEVEKVSILGVYGAPGKVYVNGNETPIDYTLSAGTIRITGLKLPINKPFSITWNPVHSVQL
jgi:hypothetical protein